MVTKLLIGGILSKDQAYHAALTVLPNPAFDTVGEHNHDFFEWMVPIAGAAAHTVNGTTTVLRPGQIVLIRPDDTHSLEALDGDTSQHINIAFSVSVWRDFVKATGVDMLANIWGAGPMPVVASLSHQSKNRITEEASALLRSFHTAPTRLAFSRFWTAAMDCHILPAQRSDNSTALPPWFRDLLEWSETIGAAHLTVESLTEKSGVTFAHLCRTMKQCTGITPTQFINSQRIKQASYELAATDKEIIDIAYEAGFENLSYFYRRFRQHHSISPRQYRLQSMLALSV